MVDEVMPNDFFIDCYTQILCCCCSNAVVGEQFTLFANIFLNRSVEPGLPLFGNISWTLLFGSFDLALDDEVCREKEQDCLFVLFFSKVFVGELVCKIVLVGVLCTGVVDFIVNEDLLLCIVLLFLLCKSEVVISPPCFFCLVEAGEGIGEGIGDKLLLCIVEGIFVCLRKKK